MIDIHPQITQRLEAIKTRISEMCQEIVEFEKMMRDKMLVVPATFCSLDWDGKRILLHGKPLAECSAKMRVDYHGCLSGIFNSALVAAEVRCRIKTVI